MYSKVASTSVLLCNLGLIALGLLVVSCSDADPSARNKAGETGQGDISKAKSWKIL